MTVVTRFAPSPTGRLHVGNIRTALHNWLLAKKAGGKFLLRIDDTDAARSEERFVEAIREDLACLGLSYDGEERQSARLALYEDAFERLKAAGRVYPCFETAQELELKRKVALGRGLPPIYDRAALELTDAERAAQDTAPHWRFKLDHDAPIEWLDGVRGPQHFEPAQMSDPVVRRAGLASECVRRSRGGRCDVAQLLLPTVTTRHRSRSQVSGARPRVTARQDQ